MSDKLKRFQQLQEQCYYICEAKNADYGDSTKVTQDIFGPTAHLVRMFDKLMRTATLIKNGDMKVVDEKLQDTLMDLANYALLMIVDLNLDLVEGRYAYKEGTCDPLGLGKTYIVKGAKDANTTSGPQPKGLIKHQNVNVIGDVTCLDANGHPRN